MLHRFRRGQNQGRELSLGLRLSAIPPYLKTDLLVSMDWNVNVIGPVLIPIMPREQNLTWTRQRTVRRVAVLQRRRKPTSMKRTRLRRGSHLLVTSTRIIPLRSPLPSKSTECRIQGNLISHELSVHQRKSPQNWR